HLGAIPARERFPIALGRRSHSRFQERSAGREVRVPDIVEVARRKLRLRNAARRKADGAEAQPFSIAPGRSQADDAYRHAGPHAYGSSFAPKGRPEARIAPPRGAANRALARA